jgi:hypothetical protein
MPQFVRKKCQCYNCKQKIGEGYDLRELYKKIPIIL